MQYTIKRLLVERLLGNPDVKTGLPRRMISELSEEFCEPWGCLLIATLANDASAIVGMGGVRRVSDETCEIRRLVVAPPFQRHGVGRTLLSCLVEFGQRMGYLRIVVEVPQSIPSLVSFYRRMGFTHRDGPADSESTSFTFLLTPPSTSRGLAWPALFAW